MNSGTCPKCGANDVVPNLKLQGHEVNPWVSISEPEPPNRPFIWVAKSARSEITASICANCGYTEFYATNYTELGEKHKQGFK